MPRLVQIMTIPSAARCRPTPAVSAKARAQQLTEATGAFVSASTLAVHPAKITFVPLIAAEPVLREGFGLVQTVLLNEQLKLKAGGVGERFEAGNVDE